VRVLLLSILIILSDQTSKLLVKGISIPWLGISIDGMRYGESRPILGDFFRLTYIENPGMAFGIDIGGKLFFSIFSVLASMAILLYLYKAREESLGLRVALAMILGGAVGNLIDRVFYGVVFGDAPLFYGRVVDFLDVDFFNINILGYHLSRWPVFNVADAAVTIGVFVLLFFHRSHSEDEVEPIALAVNTPTAARDDDPTERPQISTNQ
jgi:signal peptidase II